LRAALDAGHFYTGLKTRAGRRRPECLQQHCISMSPRETQRHQLWSISPESLCHTADTIGIGRSTRMVTGTTGNHSLIPV
jgi:hypothetical protein